MKPRAAVRIAALLLLFTICVPVHVATKLLFRRSPWPKWFLAGAAWIIGARVKDVAGAGEVLATSTVRDLVSCSGLAFAERGAQTLKGVPGEWRLFSVTS